MYQLRTPASNLQPFIEHYWFVTADDGPVDLRVNVFVDARADLIFNFGAPYQRQVLFETPIEHRASNLDAQRVQPIRVTQRGLVRVTGVRFRLGGLGAFTSRPLRPWTNATPPPADVFGETATDLEARLRDESDLDRQAQLLDVFFADAMDIEGSFADFRRALAAVEQMGAVDGAASAAGLTTRQVERLFARHLGIPPKTVARILRFQSALRALMRDPGCPLAEVAAATGYFDHAHFIKEFKRMSGGVPRGYRGYFPPESPTDFAPNVVVFLQDVASTGG